MPKTKTPLRVFGQGGVRLTEVRECLGALEHAYNSVQVLDRTLDDLVKRAKQLRRFSPEWMESFWIAGLPSPLWMPARGRARAVSWPPTAEDVASLVLPRHRLVLRGVRLESPGWWAFMGTIVAIEVLRFYLQTRAQRRKEGAPVDAQDAERRKQEDELLRVKVIEEKTHAARALGATEDDLAPLLNELLFGPLHKLDAFQDRGIIGGADYLQMPDGYDEDEEPPPSPPDEAPR